MSTSDLPAGQHGVDRDQVATQRSVLAFELHHIGLAESTAVFIGDVLGVVLEGLDIFASTIALRTLWAVNLVNNYVYSSRARVDARVFGGRLRSSCKWGVNGVTSTSLLAEFIYIFKLLAAWPDWRPSSSAIATTSCRG